MNISYSYVTTLLSSVLGNLAYTVAWKSCSHTSESHLFGVQKLNAPKAIQVLHH